MPESFHLSLQERVDLPASFDAAIDRYGHSNRLIVCDLRSLQDDVDSLYLRSEFMKIRDLLRSNGVALLIPKTSDDWNHLSVLMSVIDQVFDRRISAAANGKTCAHRHVMLEFSAAIDRRGYTAPQPANKIVTTDSFFSPAFLVGAVPPCKAEGLLKFVMSEGSAFTYSCTTTSLSQLTASTRLQEANKQSSVLQTQRGAQFWEKLLFSHGIKLDAFLEKKDKSVVIIDFTPGVGCLAVAALSRETPYIGRWNNLPEYKGSDWQKCAMPTYNRLVRKKIHYRNINKSFP